MAIAKRFKEFLKALLKKINNMKFFILLILLSTNQTWSQECPKTSVSQQATEVFTNYLELISMDIDQKNLPENEMNNLIIQIECFRTAVKNFDELEKIKNEDNYKDALNFNNNMIPALDSFIKKLEPYSEDLALAKVLRPYAFKADARK